jgi:class 3 adenylate cyclase/tetratricopeptide (TPR) repeat protein
MTRGDAGNARVLTPYVARLVVEWLRDTPDVTYRSINGTAVFADISGFTNLTEKLARRGKVGAEEMGDVLNAIFEQLLAAAYEYGAGLVKWGGDAVLLLFDGDRHAEMACRAACEMQRVIGRIGRVRTSAGTVRLRMSIGIHTGDLDFLLVGSHFRELLLTGPGATAVAQMEKIADAGEIVVSRDTAALLEAAGAPPLGDAKGDGLLLGAGPAVPRAPNRAPVGRDVDLDHAMCATLRAHLLEGLVEPEHRNVTVSFIQVQGADELLAREGPEALTAAISHFIDACQDAVVANDVTLLSSDICEDGAKVIVISGAPRSAGDDEARVLTAARNIVDAAGVLPLKAGVNCGRVFAGDFGPSYRRVYSVVGDSVNLAARLMGKAEPGQIIATPAVLERSRTVFGTTALAPFQVKGKTEPIAASVVGAIVRGRAQSAKVDMPLVGRDIELAILLEAAAKAACGEGRVVELVGPAGAGKSRLLEELVGRVDAAVLWADGDIYGTATPYQPLHRLLRQQLGVAEDAPVGEMRTLLHDLVAGIDLALLPWLPLIGIVAGVDVPMTPEVEAIDPDVRKLRLEQVTSDWLGRLLATPTIFIFNDVHFMDEASVDLFERLADDSADRPWLLIATRRPDSQPPVRADSEVAHIELEPLDAAAAAQFVALATADAPLPNHRMQALVDRASGNPLFLKELVSRASELGDDEALPDSIEGVVASRIDRLPREHRRLLRAASVLGMTVELELLDAVLNAADASAASVFVGWDDLSEFVVPTDEGHLRFAHHLIRETAYEGLPFRRRAVLHARAADIIEQRAGSRVGEHAELLSLHSFRGERYHAAWQYSRLAGDLARTRYANADAADCYRRAVESARQITSVADTDVAEVCEALSDVYVDLGEFESAERFLREARRRTGDDTTRCARLRLKTAAQRQLTGRYPDALRWLSRGRRVVEHRDDQESLELRAKLAELYAAIRHAQGRHREAITWARRSIAEARACGDRHTQAKAIEMQNVAAAVCGQAVDEASGREALELYTELGDLRGLARAHNTLGICAYFVGRWDDALAHYVASEEAYLKIGRRFDAAIAWANQAEILLEQRRYGEAEAVLGEAMREWRATKALGEIPFGNYLLGCISSRTGRFAEAMELFAGSRRDCLALGESHEVLMIDALTAECHLLAGEAERALALATETLAAISQIDGVDNAVPLLERVRGAALVALGQTELGFGSLRASLAAARQRDADHEVAATLGALLSAGAGESDREVAQWQRDRATIVAGLGIMEPQPVGQ